MRWSFSVVVLAAAVGACTVGPAATEHESQAPSSEVEPTGDVQPNEPGTSDDDGGTSDASGRADAGPDADDGILGTLSGSCGIVKTLLTTKSPSYEKNALVFVPGETYAKASLSPEAARMFDTPNAGGTSVESEIMSFEVLRHCEGAKLLKTETEVQYSAPDPKGGNSITDILVSIGGTKIGVSVTRVYKPASQPLTDADVKTIVLKKLEGINRSSERVLAEDKWQKQILHVFTANKSATDAVTRVLSTIDPAVKADTVVLLTETTGGGFVYCNPDPPLGNECPL
jgi:hypothetical protein